MSKTVKIGDDIVGQVAVGLLCNFVGSRSVQTSQDLNFDHVAWYHDAHLDP